jgi:hypothetical protein
MGSQRQEYPSVQYLVDTWSMAGPYPAGQTAWRRLTVPRPWSQLSPNWAQPWHDLNSRKRGRGSHQSHRRRRKHQFLAKIRVYTQGISSISGQLASWIRSRTQEPRLILTVISESPDDRSAVDQVSVSPEEAQELRSFTQRLARDANAAYSLQGCQNPEEILSLAANLGYKVSFEALLAHIWDLEADHWPWAQRGRRWRMAFMRQHVR